MENADSVHAWHDLYVMFGSSAAALIGLLFVAASLHLSEVVSNPGFRIRAYYTTLYLLTLLVEAVLVLTPQSLPLLGAGICAINIVGLCLDLNLVYLSFYRHRALSVRGGMRIARAVPYITAYLLGIAGGIGLMRGSLWGMYLVTVSYTALLVTIVLGAWSIMLGIGRTEEASG
jgi:hypothetical protein